MVLSMIDRWMVKIHHWRLLTQFFNVLKAFQKNIFDGYVLLKSNMYPSPPNSLVILFKNAQPKITNRTNGIIETDWYDVSVKVKLTFSVKCLVHFLTSSNKLSSIYRNRMIHNVEIYIYGNANLYLWSMYYFRY